MINSIEMLSDELKYSKITDSLHEGVSNGFGKPFSYKIQEFRVLPDNDKWPFISIVFDVVSDKHSLIQIGFGKWHDHFELYEDEKTNIKEALFCVKKLISKDYFILETYKRKMHIKSRLVIDRDLGFVGGLNDEMYKVVFNEPRRKLY